MRVRSTWEYDFLSVNLKDTTDIMLLGWYAIGAYNETIPPDNRGNIQISRIYQNNTGLSEALKDKMEEVGANVCISTAFKNDGLVVNLLMPDGMYTTVFFE